MIVLVDQEGVVPKVDELLLRDMLDVGIIHDHALVGCTFGFYDLPRKRDFDGVAVAMEVAALAFVVGDSVPRVEFETSRDQHVRLAFEFAVSNYTIALNIAFGIPMPQSLNIHEHSRSSVGLTYVYPVVSRRSGGISVGINLNPNNACNWRCIYCQVPDLKRGAAPEVDLNRLESELTEFLHELLHGNFMNDRVPEDLRRINDIAISGNGEPTTAEEFDSIAELIGEIVVDSELPLDVKLVLITNGSLIHRPHVQEGLKRMALLNGEVWFKLDSATPDGRKRINDTSVSNEKVLENLALSASLCPTWLQTCVFALDGVPFSKEERQAYVEFVSPLAGQLKGVLLYGLARKSCQPEASRLAPVSREWLSSFGEDIGKTGLPVKIFF